jgi:hypothetical protein
MSDAGVDRGAGVAGRRDGRGYLLCRAVRSRPILSLTSTKLSGAVLRMVNPTDDNILIREVIFQPEVYALALRGPAYLVGRIAPHAVAELPFVVSDRTLEAENQKSSSDHRSVAQGEGAVVAPDSGWPLDLQGRSAPTAKHCGEHRIVTASKGNVPETGRKLRETIGSRVTTESS